MKHAVAGVAASVIVAIAVLGLTTGQHPSAYPIDAVPVAHRVAQVTKPAPVPVHVAAVIVKSTAPIQARMATMSLRTQPCTGSARSESAVGLMNNSAIHSHCDFP